MLVTHCQRTACLKAQKAGEAKTGLASHAVVQQAFRPCLVA